ncbi:protein archease-like [Harmonia axyridis]|uniref:protein archease-like n=1 Tax=Harmonia axyridis TaxID=115357 RepID=UPI001E2776ED|nr:protein archease-like [Harmonia axyridis]
METFTEAELEIPPCKYEYLDHTADVQIHSWGNSLKETFEQCGMAMYGYMTELPSVEIKQCVEIEADGHDLESLLYKFLDELLFLFSCEPYLICKKIEITQFIIEGEDMRIKCKCYGEEFQIGKHPQGTEVKAITYSAMQIINDPDKNDFQIFVIIDI